ncbi:MAG: [protein-PII] uridylyltransferase [Rhodocyclaceae bacterium]
MGDAQLRELVAGIKVRLQQAQEGLRREYEIRPRAAALLRARASAVDRVLREVWRRCSLPSDACLVAVGGYGRAELFPDSDVDLLVLVPAAGAPAVSGKVERLVTAAWDAGLELGHAVRSLEECVQAAQADITVQTNLLDARRIAGSRRLYGEFCARLAGSLDAPSFFRAKRLEQEERYSRFNDTPYSLEPNCKESPGGLRDLQVILWVARAARLGRGWMDLARSGLLLRGEALQLRRAEEFLRHVRIRLHHLAGRREDRVVFDHQEALARAFGIEATRVRRAAELFMQRYYRNAKLVTQLNTILMQNLAARLTEGPAAVCLPVNERFQMERELLDVRDEQLFERQPGAMLEAFLLLEQRPELKGMSARSLRALWRARRRIDRRFRCDPAHRALFMKLLQERRGITHEFRRMNQWGILGRYLPAFGRIVGQMQHDLFHVYTVDQHILQVLRNLRRFTTAEHAHEYPLCSRLITGLAKPWILYVAALFHDIAKGRGGDHSILGAREARRFCRAHGVSAQDTEAVGFLVENHLALSAVAQKQDLADPEVIRAFAKRMGDETRLTQLYLLTHADIRGTSPKVWNNWKARLIEDLFNATLALLRGAAPSPGAGIAQRQEEARALLRFHGLRPGVETALWRELDTVYFMRHDAADIAWHTRLLYYRPDAADPVVKARLNRIGEGLEVVVYARDEPELFGRLCGYFAHLGYSIVDARIHTTRKGYALDSFILLDPSERLGYRDTISLIEHDLTQRIASHAPADRPAAVRPSRQVRHFPISPEVAIRPDEKGACYLMSVSAMDRPGLLASIAQVLAGHRIDVHTAKIATLGERVEDVFLISGAELDDKPALLRLEQELLAALASP